MNVTNTENKLYIDHKLKRIPLLQILVVKSFLLYLNLLRFVEDMIPEYCNTSEVQFINWVLGKQLELTVHAEKWILTFNHCKGNIAF